jgi:hypothetical protein
MNDNAGPYPDLPKSALLWHTVRRARTIAEQRSHRYVMLEHLLLALLDDADAQALLASMKIDSTAIRAEITDVINQRMATLVAPGGLAPSFSYKFDLATQTASQEALRMGRGEINGALVLIAVAKDPESFAASLLVKHGFKPLDALSKLAVNGPNGVERALPSSPPPPPPLPMRPNLGQNSSTASPAGGASAQQTAAQGQSSAPLAQADDAGPTMDDMLASVRDILDEEDRKGKGLPPRPATTTTRKPLEARREPRLGTPVRHEGYAQPLPSRSPPPPPLQAPLPPQPRLPGPLSSGAPPGAGPRLPPPRPVPAPAPALQTPQQSAPVAARQRREPELRKRQPAHAAPAANPAKPAAQAVFAGKLAENIPRSMRVAIPEVVEVRLSKEDSTALLSGMKGRGEAQTHNVSVTRAMTIRLRAPEGGFFIETLSPETQWVFDRPSFLGGESFGRWVWTVIPNERGRRRLQLVAASRNIDENGLAGDIALPEQIVEIKVRTNYKRSFARLFKSLFLILLGGALTEGGLYLARTTFDLGQFLNR